MVETKKIGSPLSMHFYICLTHRVDPLSRQVKTESGSRHVMWGRWDKSGNDGVQRWHVLLSSVGLVFSCFQV